jgi:phosphate transport system substrate-binding protein
MSRAFKIFSLTGMLLLSSVLTTRPAYPLKSRTPAPVAPAVTRAQTLAIIVNRANPTDNLSSEELRRYFLGERTRWDNGRKVTVIMRAPGQPERDAVLRLIYRMREQEFNFHFLHAQFTGELQGEPKVLDATPALIKYVAFVPGALAYVRAAEVEPSVKVLRIDGLMPDDAGYKISF